MLKDKNFWTFLLYLNGFCIVTNGVSALIAMKEGSPFGHHLLALAVNSLAFFACGHQVSILEKKDK